MREHKDGDFLFGGEFTTLARNLMEKGNAVLDGCAISDAGFDLTVGSGDVAVENEEYSFGGDTITVDPETTFDWRYDLLVIKIDAGSPVLDMIKGTVNKTSPSLPDDNLLLAVVQMVKDDPSISEVYDARMILKLDHDLLGNVVEDNHHVKTRASDGLEDDGEDIKLADHGNAFHDPNFATETAFNNHSARHEDGGADVINVGGLSGVLSDDQPPQTHGNAKHSPNFAQDPHDNSAHNPDFAEKSVFETHQDRARAHIPLTVSFSGKEDVPEGTSWQRVAGFRTPAGRLYITGVSIDNVVSPGSPGTFEIRVRCGGTTRYTTSTQYLQISEPLVDLSSYVVAGTVVTVDIRHSLTSNRILSWAIAFAIQTPLESDW